MKLDKNAVERLLSLDDAQLKQVIATLGKEAGFDLSGLSVSASDLSGLRRALSGATEEDLRRAAEQMEAAKRVRRNRQ